MVERLKELCKERGTNFKRLEKELGIGNGTIAKSAPTMRCDRLKLLADYFNVTMEYLLTGQKASEPVRMSPKLSGDAQELMSRYLLLDQSDRGKLSAYLDGLLAAEKYDKKESFA